jgi:quinol monooxygenase YgiN
MIIEYVRYVIPAARHAEFLAAYAAAADDLRAAPECRRYEISQGVEEPDNFVVRIEWDTMEGHLTGFRGGPHFGPFFAKVKPFFADIREMKHYHVHGAGAGASASAS